MDLVAHLENVLYRYQTAPPSEELRIAGWRFSVTEHSVVKAGIRDNKLGEVYAAPTLTQGLSGDLLIIWPGNFCSHAVVNSAVINLLEEKLPFWKQGSFQDREGSVLIQPEPLPLVALEHREVLNMVKQDPRPAFHLLDRYRADLSARGIGVIQAGVQAGWGLRHIRTSKGLAVSYAQTSFQTYVAADGLFSKGFAKRRPPTELEIEDLISTVGNMTGKLKDSGQLNSGKMTVIFTPDLVGEFLGKYLLTNLSGNNVVNNQSAFSLQDFQDRRPVFSQKLSVLLNPLKPFEISSYLCTREGMPASAQYLVQGGKILTPFLTVKDALKAGLKPTPLPQGNGLWLETDYAGTLAELIASTDNGILVHSVLGLHTQDSTSGSYSLSAPHCLKIENGKLIGRVKAVLNGNFFTHLNDEETVYGLSAGEKLPAMKFTAQVGKD